MPRHPSWRSIVSVGLFVSAGVLPAAAQPHLVTDLNQGRVPANLQPQPSQGIEQDGVLYFPGQDPQHGYELWRTDGTAEGTYRLVDICPGSCWGGGGGLGFFHGFLYFLGNDREHGVEIWRTDGTVGGEELLGDLCPGACGIGLSGWVERGGALWFLTQESGETPILWTSDGTPAGTKPFANLCTDLGICGFADNSAASLAGPDPSGQGFILWTSTDALSLFRIDGTAGGTELLHRFTTPFLSPQAAKDGAKGPWESLKSAVGPIARTAAEAGEPLFFLDGFDLWTSDGTPVGTHLVRNVEGLLGFSRFLQSVRIVDGNWYAIFDDGDWLRSDGTAEGTFELAKVDSQYGLKLARIGDAVFALTSKGFWRAGGTPETTVRFDAPIGDVVAVVERPERLFVAAYDRSSFVWSTDGTAVGTRRYHLDGPPNPDGYEIGGFGDGVMISVGYRELWRIDPAGAARLHDFQPANGGSGPVDQITLGNRLLFVSLPDESGRLFSTDGTTAGTVAISPNVAGYFGFEYQPQVYRLTLAGRRAFFTSFGRVWTSDGTAAGTRFFRPEYSGSSHVLTAPIGVVGNRFVFGANFRFYPLQCDPGDTEPWVSDGTQRGTKRILNLNPFDKSASGGSQCETVAASSSPGPGVSFGSFALFAADDLLHGRELFLTDGTKEGTRLVADLNRKRMPNPSFEPNDPVFGPALIGVGSAPSDLVRAGSRAFFVADDGTTGRELWVTNGTRRGTRRLDLVPGPVGSSPHDLVAVGDGIYFFAADGAGEGLYKSDGTRRGTVLVSDLVGVSQAKALTVAQDKLFFVAFRSESGTELWTSLGTAATTREVADLRPGPRGSLPQNLKAVADRVVFAAEDGTTGLEPWISDGTAEGTHPWGDIAPGPAASSPGPFSVAHGQILFGADDGEHGRELWALPVADLHP